MRCTRESEPLRVSRHRSLIASLRCDEDAEPVWRGFGIDGARWLARGFRSGARPSSVPRMIDDETGEPVCDECKGARTVTPAISEGKAITLGWLVDGKANVHVCPECKPAS
jgi:hypothetical protein